MQALSVSNPIICKMAVPVTTSKDAIFHILMGSDHSIIMQAIEKSAHRIAAYIGTNSALHLANEGRRSVTHAQAVFVVFLYADPELRKEVLEGKALAIRTRAMCEYKASVLFPVLYDRVLSGWLKTELNTPSDLVNTFEQEYLVS